MLKPSNRLQLKLLPPQRVLEARIRFLEDARDARGVLLRSLKAMLLKRSVWWRRRLRLSLPGLIPRKKTAMAKLLKLKLPAGGASSATSVIRRLPLSKK